MDIHATTVDIHIPKFGFLRHGDRLSDPGPCGCTQGRGRPRGNLVPKEFEIVAWFP